MSHARRLWLLVPVLVALLVPVLLVGSGGPARADTSGPLPIEVSLTSISPTALTPDTALTVTGTVRNAGRVEYTGLQVILRLDWRPLTDRRQLAEWAGLDPRDPANGTKQVGVPLGYPLRPGATASFTVMMRGDAVQLPVSAEGFGPRRMAVEIQDGVTSGPRVGIVRTYAVWAPVQGYRPTRLAMLVPVTPGRQPVDPLGQGGQVPQLWESGGRLARTLAATTDPAFSYAVDPALLNAATATQSRQPGRPRGAPYGLSPGAGPAGSSTTSGATTSGATTSDATTSDTTTSSRTTSGTTSSRRPSRAPARATSSATSPTVATTTTTATTAPPANPFDPAVAARAKAVLDRLRTSLTGREVLRLPYADPDVAALADGYRTVLDDAEREGAKVTSETLGKELPGGLVWPAQSRADVLTAGLAADGSNRTLILPASAATTAEPGGTAPVHAALTLPNGTAETLFADDVLSAALGGTGGRDPVLATQRLLAETAAVTAAHPTESPVVLATVPRDWNPDPASVLASLTTLKVAPWLQLTPVTSARTAPAAAVDRSQLAAPAVQPVSRLPLEHVRIIARQLHRLDDFTLALTEEGDEAVVAPLRRSALEMLSTSWISRQKGVGPARGILTEEVNGLYQGVTVVAGSSANLLARTGQLPVTIHNDLPVAVRVILQLHPLSGRVNVTPLSPVTVEPGKTRTVRVQLRAVANGEVRIESWLTTPRADGAVIGSAPPLTVRVHYDWEDRGLKWIGAALALLLVGGLFRSVRRGRVRIAPEAVPDPDDVGLERRPEPVAVSAEASGGPSAPPADLWPQPGPSARAPQVTPTVGAAPTAPLASGMSELSGASGASGTSGMSGASGASGASAGMVSSSAVMAAGTLASRVLGVVRTVVLAWAIGQQSLSADAFATANTLPNSLMALIAGGVLNAVLVPQIIRAAKRSDGGKDYLDRLLTLAILVLGGATLLATAAAPVLVGFYHDERWTEQQVQLATVFALWCLPQIFFYGLYTIYGQVLNARGSFGPYMWAPVVNNVVAIAGTLVFIAVHGSGRTDPGWWGGSAIALLAGTTTLGIVAQAVVLLPAMRRSGYRWHPRWGWRGIGLSTAGRIAGWTLAATAAGQLGLIFISRAANSAGARGAQLGVPAPGRQVYDNAYLLFILPHSLVAVSLVTAVFTRMSISASSGATDEVRTDASLALRLTGLATVISTVAILVLGPDLTRGIFVQSPVSDTDALAGVTMAMALGLVPFSAQYLFSRVFYAYEDARTPFWIQLVVITTWAGGSLLCAATLRPGWVVPGIGVAMSVSNFLGAGLSMLVLRRRLGGLDGGTLLRAHARLVLAGLVAGGAGWVVRSGVHAVAGDGLTDAYLALAVAGTVMIGVYLGVLRLLRTPELDQLVTPLRARLRR